MPCNHETRLLSSKCHIFNSYLKFLRLFYIETQFSQFWDINTKEQPLALRKRIISQDHRTSYFKLYFCLYYVQVCWLFKTESFTACECNTLIYIYLSITFKLDRSNLFLDNHFFEKYLMDLVISTFHTDWELRIHLFHLKKNDNESIKNKKYV